MEQQVMDTFFKDENPLLTESQLQIIMNAFSDQSLSLIDAYTVMFGDKQDLGELVLHFQTHYE